MTKAAARTGVGPTMTVAVEQHCSVDQRIAVDDPASRILPRDDAQGKLIRVP